MEHVENPDIDALAKSKDPLSALRRIQQNAVEEHEGDREVYLKEKRGDPLSKDEHARVERYRSTRTRLRQARRGQGGMSLMTKLDLMVYFFFALALYFALKWEYKIDLLPHILDFLRPNFDHLDDNGNWRAHSDEL